MVDKHRAMPVVVDGGVWVVRFEPETASGTPLNHAEKTFHAMADRIEALEAVVEALEMSGIACQLHPEGELRKALAALGDGDG